MYLPLCTASSLDSVLFYVEAIDCCFFIIDYYTERNLTQNIWLMSEVLVSSGPINRDQWDKSIQPKNLIGSIPLFGLDFSPCTCARFCSTCSVITSKIAFLSDHLKLTFCRCCLFYWCNCRVIGWVTTFTMPFDQLNTVPSTQNRLTVA